MQTHTGPVVVVSVSVNPCEPCLHFQQIPNVTRATGPETAL